MEEIEMEAHFLKRKRYKEYILQNDDLVLITVIVNMIGMAVIPVKITLIHTSKKLISNSK